MLELIAEELRELIGNEQVTEQMRKLLLALGNETISVKKLLKRLNLKLRQSFSQIYLKPTHVSMN